MVKLAAIVSAIQIQRNPDLIRRTRTSRLPSGMTDLLRLIARQDDAVEASRQLGVSCADVLSAAEVFVEKVLFAANADSYRVLGANPDAPRERLRLHMVLLMKWLHADLVQADAAPRSIERAAYAHRVTQAWETLKSNARRVDYDATLHVSAAKSADATSTTSSATDASDRRSTDAPIAKKGKAATKRRRKMPGLVMYKLESDDLVSRLFSFVRVRLK